MADTLHYLLDTAAAALRSVNPQLTEEPIKDSGGVEIYWFLSPEQHVVEWVLHHVILLPLIFYLMRFEWPVDVPRRSSSTSIPSVLAGKKGTAQSKRSFGWLDAVDYALRAQCFINAIATIFYKASTDRTAYLFQPCHLSNYLLCWLCFDSSEFASKLFYFYINFWYGTMLALVAPDLRGLHMTGEQFNFFSQHAMLFILPALWIYKRRYTMYKSFWLLLMMWSMSYLMHFDLLLPVSLYLHGNVNYMLVPPKVLPSWLQNQFYRPVVGLFCILLALLSRYGFAELVIRLSGIRTQAKLEAPIIAMQAAKLGDIDILQSPTLGTPITPVSDIDATPQKSSGSVARKRNQQNRQ